MARRPDAVALVVLDQATGTIRSDDRTIFGVDLAPGVDAALSVLRKARIKRIAFVPGGSRTDLQALRKHLPAFDDVAVKAPASAAIVVAADRIARARLARSARAAYPHAALAALAVPGGDVVFACVRGSRLVLDRLTQTVPYFVEREASGRWMLFAAMTRSAVASAIARGAAVEILPLDYSTSDPLLVHIDPLDESAEQELAKHRVLWRAGSRAVIALGPDVFNDAVAMHGAHGHFLALAPRPGLLHMRPPARASRDAQFVTGRLPLEKLRISEWIRDLLELLFRTCPATAASFQSDVDRFSGAASLDSSGAIASRHIRHPDNARVVQALLAELRAIGYCAYTHSFTHAGMTLKNVIADLPGTGLFRIDPDILEALRRILIRFPIPEPDPPWLPEVRGLFGREWVRQHVGNAKALDARLRLERAVGWKPWWPWWRRLCPLAGFGADLVIVGCHLDSTAARAAGYDPTTDPAPGADDDATGIAATLAMARHFWSMRGKLPHTIRFCFFNAEEQGLVGSKAYAAMLKAADAPIRAVVCADMIGHNSDAERLFEVHAGYTDPAVRDASVPVADCIASWAATLGALPAAQVYKGTSSTGGPDRNTYDGAINRSDHAAFHENGYPAVVVSEDFFVNLATEPGADPNPNYHDSDDLSIDAAYAADITCAVAYAVKELAGG